MLTTAIKSTSIAQDGDIPAAGPSSGSGDGSNNTDASVPEGAATVSAVAQLSGATPQADTTLIDLDKFRADPRFAGIDGHGVSVVVIDTGIDLSHSFFGPDANHNGVDDRIVYSYDFSGGNDPDASDHDGHGTNVSSIIGSQDPTYTGMAPGVNIIALKVFPDAGGGASSTDIAEALNWVVANRSAYNIVAVNMSLGFGDNQNTPTSSIWASQIATLAANNTAVVVASGNSYASYEAQGVSSPSSDPNAWSIGAVWDRNAGGFSWVGGAIDYSTGPDHIASFSQRSTTMTTVFAPGGQITGGNWNGGTITESGTSQAAPHVAGLVADMQQLALQVSGHLLSVGQLKADMIAGSTTIFDGDDENDDVNNTMAAYHRVDALGWGIQVLADLFSGTSGSDALNGTAAGDTIHGGLGSDTLSGNDGNDTLFGDAGDDTLSGGNGNDILNGGPGTDTLTGGAGSDAFVYGAGYGTDTIADFSHAQADRIDVSGILDVHSLADVMSISGQVGADTVFSLGTGSSLTVKNDLRSTFVSSDFTFNSLIEAAGVTGLVEVGTNYFMYALGSASGVELSLSGAAVVAGQMGAWAPIAAEQVSGGYDVAWKFGTADQYTIWTTDGSGNAATSPPAVSGSDLGLETAETIFQQDLNGDGRIGTAPVVIESSGATSLVEVNRNFFLYPVNGSSGPELRSGGIAFAAGQFGSWMPIGAELISGGYEVAWKMGTSDQYTVWTTDSNGNDLTSPPAVSGSDAGFQALETSFQQDLNGDGRIGPPPPPPATVIEANGVTSLVRVGNNFFLYPVGGSSGPELSSGGMAFVAGQFGPWTPIAAERTSSGYDVAWKMGTSDQYTVWTTDNNGNDLTSPAAVSGSDAGLQTLETTFQQDLNGDGQIGPTSGSSTPPSGPATVIEANGATSLVRVGNNFFLYPAGGSSGPELGTGGAAFVAGQFGPWTPIAAERTSSGYDVAWKMGTSDQYTVWTTDNNGNDLTSPPAVSGSDAGLQTLETTFQQDLNGDGRIGPSSGSSPPSGSTTVIEANGATSLVQVGNNFFLYPVGGSSGPELSTGGTPFAAGQFGPWTPIAAEQTSSGYDVAWKMGTSDQYTVWTTDNNGNDLTSPPAVSGSDPGLQALETTFQQDLNGDGQIGPPSGSGGTVIEADGATSLVRVGNNFFLYSVGGSSGPELSSGGTPFAAGQFGPWMPIGAEQTSSGYDVAWKMGASDQYTVWTTDNSGNDLTSPPAVSGSDPGLQALETTFHQDLNGDGHIGVSTSSLLAASDDFGTLGYAAGLAPAAGNAGSDSVLQTLTSYMASTFAAPAGAAIVAPPPQDNGQDFLTRPAA